MSTSLCSLNFFDSTSVLYTAVLYKKVLRVLTISTKSLHNYPLGPSGSGSRQALNPKGSPLLAQTNCPFYLSKKFSG